MKTYISFQLKSSMIIIILFLIPSFMGFRQAMSQEIIYAELRENVQFGFKAVLNNLKEEEEEEIYKLSERIDKLADSLEYNIYSPEITQSYKNSILKIKEDQLRQFEGKDSVEKEEASETIINCLKGLQKRLIDGKYMAENEAIVDEAYMEQRLNPYTYTRMNLRSYEKLFNAYQDKLVPYFVQKIDPENDCEIFLQKIDNLKNLQVYMIKILERQEARKLERRIRNNDSPETLIDKLGIPFK